MKNAPDGWPRIAPAVFYNDAAAAIDWLSRAFGFAVQERVENDAGQISKLRPDNLRIVMAEPQRSRSAAS